MKLLLVIVSIIAVFTVDCRESPGEHEDLGSAEETQYLPGDGEGNNSPDEDSNPTDTDEDYNLKDTSLPVAQAPQDSDFAEVDQMLEKQGLTNKANQDPSLEEEKDQQEHNLRRLRCKARNACVVMGGFCVTNATLCGGRLVPEGCKGLNCQCCVPGTLENKIRDLEQDLSSMKDNLTDANARLSVEFQSRMDNLTDANSRLNMEFQFKMDNLTDIISNMGSKLDSFMRRCPAGFFHTAGSYQCYKFYNDTRRSWTEAKEKCQSEGLALAEPANPLSLRKYLVETYASVSGSSAYAYLGARGTGSYFRWERSARQLSNSDSLWNTGNPAGRVSSTYCLLLLVEKNHYFVNYPNQPYHTGTCTTKRDTVCEYIME